MTSMAQKLVSSGNNYLSLQCKKVHMINATAKARNQCQDPENSGRVVISFLGS